MAGVLHTPLDQRPVVTVPDRCSWCRRHRRSPRAQTGLGERECAALARTGVTGEQVDGRPLVTALAIPRALGAGHDVYFVCPGGRVQAHGEPDPSLRGTHRVVNECPALRAAGGSYEIQMLTAAEILDLPAR